MKAILNLFNLLLVSQKAEYFFHRLYYFVEMDVFPVRFGGCKMIKECIQNKTYRERLITNIIQCISHLHKFFKLRQTQRNTFPLCNIFYVKVCNSTKGAVANTFRFSEDTVCIEQISILITLIQLKAEFVLVLICKTVCVTIASLQNKNPNNIHTARICRTCISVCLMRWVVLPLSIPQTPF